MKEQLRELMVRQSSCASARIEALRNMGEMVASEIEKTEDAPTGTRREPGEGCCGYDTVHKAHKTFYARIKRFKKEIDRTYHKRCFQVERMDDDVFGGMGENAIDLSVARYLRRRGHVRAADKLHREKDESAIKQMSQIVEIMKAVDRRDIDRLLQWTSTHASFLRRGRGWSRLEFQLKRLQFFRIAKEKSPADAIAFARAEMSEFCEHRPKDMQRLMASLLFVQDSKESGENATSTTATCPSRIYNADEDTLWIEVRDAVHKHVCRISGVPVRSPLETAVEAGIEAEQTLIKFQMLMTGSDYGVQKKWSTDQVPVSVALPDAFQFHSVFVCPVSQEVTSEANPPMLLVCGHAISRT